MPHAAPVRGSAHPSHWSHSKLPWVLLGACGVLAFQALPANETQPSPKPVARAPENSLHHARSVAPEVVEVAQLALPCAENRLILKEQKREITTSDLWGQFMSELEGHLINNCTAFQQYRKLKWNPQVFSWPERAPQGYVALRDGWMTIRGTVLEEAALQSDMYGPPGVHTVKIPGQLTEDKTPVKIQLDRVQQIWSLNVLWQGLGLDLADEDTVLIEFGGGTGQMADVVKSVGFGGRHVVYDFTVMALMQRKFLKPRGVNGRFIGENGKVKRGATNYLSSGASKAFHAVYGMDKVNFIATYSFTEADLDTRNAIKKYMPKFERIYVLFWGKWQAGSDKIDNVKYMRGVERFLQPTHDTVTFPHSNNGFAFLAIRKDLGKINCAKKRIVPCANKI